ncbi:MAG: class I SAM-dependent methyltransferase, partial [archaeon]
KSFNGILKGKKVLELGVGNGKTLKSIVKDKPKSISAIDFSKKAIDICKSEFRDKKIEFIEGDVNDLPFEDESFDMVVCYYVLNNLNKDDQIKTVKEIHRVLSNNGKVLFEDFAKGDFRDDGKEEKSGLIKNYFNLRQIKELFSDFSGVEIKIREFNTIKSDPELKRKIIAGIIKK